jgi:hypothetical protein
MMTAWSSKLQAAPKPGELAEAAFATGQSAFSALPARLAAIGFEPMAYPPAQLPSKANAPTRTGEIANRPAAGTIEVVRFTIRNTPHERWQNLAV